MKNDFLNTLINKAQQEESPKVYVSDKVIAILTADERRLGWFWNKPMMWIAALSSALAVPSAVLAFILNNIWVGPLYEISKVISWVM